MAYNCFVRGKVANIWFLWKSGEQVYFLIIERKHLFTGNHVLAASCTETKKLTYAIFSYLLTPWDSPNKKLISLDVCGCGRDIILFLYFFEKLYVCVKSPLPTPKVPIPPFSRNVCFMLISYIHNKMFEV